VFRSHQLGDMLGFQSVETEPSHSTSAMTESESKSLALAPANAKGDVAKLLASAQYEYRLANFPSAFRACKQVVESPEFGQLKDKKKHEAVKTFIACGYHNRK
jgi:hypothetical protein